MNENRTGRTGPAHGARTILLALLLALFGAAGLAQDDAQQDGAARSQDGAQAETAGDQAVIELGSDDVVTQAEFEQEFERATRALALQQGLPYNEETREVFESFRAQFLDQLAVRNALLMEAEARGLSVADEEVEQQISQAQESLGEEQFQQAVQDLGFDSVDAYRESVREGLLTQRVIDELRAEIEVTDEQIQTFFDENQESFAGQELDQVREQVRAGIVNERLNEQFADLRQQHGIETFPERVAATTQQEDGVAGGGEAGMPADEEQPAGGEGDAGPAEGDQPDVVTPDADAPSAEEDVEQDEVPAVEDVEEEREDPAGGNDE